MPRGGARCVESAGGRLVDGRAPADRTGAGCAVEDGDLAAAAAGVVHHIDQGAQYTSIAFGQRCRQAVVRPSTGAAGMHMTTGAPGRLHPLPESPVTPTDNLPSPGVS